MLQPYNPVRTAGGSGSSTLRRSLAWFGVQGSGFWVLGSLELSSNVCKLRDSMADAGRAAVWIVPRRGAACRRAGRCLAAARLVVGAWVDADRRLHQRHRLDAAALGNAQRISAGEGIFSRHRPQRRQRASAHRRRRRARRRQRDRPTSPRTRGRSFSRSNQPTSTGRSRRKKPSRRRALQVPDAARTSVEKTPV